LIKDVEYLSKAEESEEYFSGVRSFALEYALEGHDFESLYY
jgi:hypothetical protein